MTFDEQVVREQICDVCHKMWQLGWVAANDGNVSVRIDEDTIIAVGYILSAITALLIFYILGKMIRTMNGAKVSHA